MSKEIHLDQFKSSVTKRSFPDAKCRRDRLKSPHNGRDRGFPQPNVNVDGVWPKHDSTLLCFVCRIGRGQPSQGRHRHVRRHARARGMGTESLRALRTDRTFPFVSSSRVEVPRIRFRVWRHLNNGFGVLPELSAQQRSFSFKTSHKPHNIPPLVSYVLT